MHVLKTLVVISAVISDVTASVQEALQHHDEAARTPDKASQPPARPVRFARKQKSMARKPASLAALEAESSDAANRHPVRAWGVSSQNVGGIAEASIAEAKRRWHPAQQQSVAATSVAAAALNAFRALDGAQSEQLPPPRQQEYPANAASLPPSRQFGGASVNHANAGTAAAGTVFASIPATGDVRIMQSHQASRMAEMTEPPLSIFNGALSQCTLWQCSCVGMAKLFGVHNGVTWGSASRFEQEWWATNQCNQQYSMEDQTDCTQWQCTCAGMGSEFGTIAKVTFGSAPHDAQQWWATNKCDDQPTPKKGVVSKAIPEFNIDCAQWQCTCAGMGSAFGTVAKVTFGSADSNAQQWWAVNKCDDQPTPKSVLKVAGSKAMPAAIAPAVPVVTNQHVQPLPDVQRMIGGQTPEVQRMIAVLQELKQLARAEGITEAELDALADADDPQKARIDIIAIRMQGKKPSELLKRAREAGMTDQELNPLEYLIDDPTIFKTQIIDAIIKKTVGISTISVSSTEGFEEQPGSGNVSASENCATWGCTCQGLINAFEGSSQDAWWESAPSDTKSWWQRHGCEFLLLRQEHKRVGRIFPTVVCVVVMFFVLWVCLFSEWLDKLMLIGSGRNLSEQSTPCACGQTLPAGSQFCGRCSRQAADAPNHGTCAGVAVPDDDNPDMQHECTVTAEHCDGATDKPISGIDVSAGMSQSFRGSSLGLSGHLHRIWSAAAPGIYAVALVVTEALYDLIVHARVGCSDVRERCRRAGAEWSRPL